MVSFVRYINSFCARTVVIWITSSTNPYFSFANFILTSSSCIIFYTPKMDPGGTKPVSLNCNLVPWCWYIYSSGSYSNAKRASWYCWTFLFRSPPFFLKISLKLAAVERPCWFCASLPASSITVWNLFKSSLSSIWSNRHSCASYSDLSN